MSLRFETLWPLALLLVLPLVWWVGARGRRNLAPRHRTLLIALRTGALIALALAAVRPAWHQRSQALSVVYALDVSRSVSPSFVTGALDWIERFQAEARPAHSRIVAFADRPVVLSSVGEVRALEVADAAGRNERIAQDASDIERALDASLLALEGEHLKRIILLSDGNQTAGNVWRVLPRLQQAGVRVYPIPAAPRHPSDTWLEAIELPEDLRARQPATATVRVFSPNAGPASITLLRGTRTLASRRVELKPGMNAVSFQIRLPAAGTAELVAEVTVAGDALAENNRIRRSVWVAEAPRVLYVEGTADAASYLAKALEGEGFEVQVSPASQLPVHAAQLARYDLLILSDVPARALANEQMQAVASYVRDLGGGLLFAGGENTFGEEGYARSAIEKALPVEFQAQDKRKDLALVIAIDRSYSMKGRKMEYAKEAARASLDLLEEQHRFAVVAFDSQPYISVPMQQVRSKRRAEDQISRIQASGQTNIYPALGVVYRMLQQVESKAKHVILLSDGDTHPADFERLVARMKGAGIVVSTVTIGEGGDPQLMENIAKWGGGRDYLAANAESIPQIFAEETRKATRENMVEDSVRPVVSRRLAALAGIDFERAPALRGLVATRARETAEVSLATQDGAPLFARWQYGLGKSAVFASDVKNRWAADWLRWEGYGRFWGQLVRDVMRRENREAFDLRVQQQGDSVSVSLSVLDTFGRFRNGLTPRVRVAAAGEEKLLALRQNGPGSYAVSIASETGQALRVSLAPGGGITAAAAARAGVHVVSQEFAPELRSLPPDMELLQAVASATGGKMLPGVDDVVASHGDVIEAARPLWHWLTLVALLLYLADIFVRRAPLAWRRLGS